MFHFKSVKTSFYWQIVLHSLLRHNKRFTFWLILYHQASLPPTSLILRRPTCSNIVSTFQRGYPLPSALLQVRQEKSTTPTYRKQHKIGLKAVLGHEIVFRNTFIHLFRSFGAPTPCLKKRPTFGLL